MSSNPYPHLPEGLHIGGITWIVTVPKAHAPAIVARLTACHDHVFIVDQSMGSRTNFGVSETGLECIREAFPDLQEIK
jgi:hypothetical protein